MIKELTKFISNNTDFNINKIGTEIKNELELEIDEEEIMMNYMRIITKTLKECNIPQKIIDHIIENYKYGLLTFDEKYISDIIKNYINNYETNIEGELKNTLNLEGDHVKLDQNKIREILEENIVPEEMIDGIVKNLDGKILTIKEIMYKIMDEINYNITVFLINRNKFKNNLSDVYRKIEENIGQRNSKNLKPKYIKCIKEVLKKYGISNILIKEFENILSEEDFNSFIENPETIVNQILEKFKKSFADIQRGTINKNFEWCLNNNQDTNIISTTSIIEILNTNINNLLNGLSFSHENDKIKQLIIYIIVLEIFNQRKMAEDARNELSEVLLKPHDEIQANKSVFQYHESKDPFSENKIHYDINTTKKSREYNDKNFIKIINESIYGNNISYERWDKIYDIINDIKNYLNNNLNYKDTEIPVDNIIQGINNILEKQNLVEIIYNDGLLYVNKLYRYNIDPEKGIKLLYEKINELLNQYKESNGDSELKLIIFCIGIMSKLNEIKKTMKKEKGQIKDENKKILTSMIKLIDEDNIGDDIQGTVSKLKRYLERKQYGDGKKDIIDNIYEIVKNSLPNARYYKNTLQTLKTNNFRLLQSIDYKIQIILLKKEITKLIQNYKTNDLFNEDTLVSIVVYTAMVQELEKKVKMEKYYIHNKQQAASKKEPGIVYTKQEFLDDESIKKQERTIEEFDGSKFANAIQLLINEENLTQIQETTIVNMITESKDIKSITKKIDTYIKRKKLNLVYYRKLLINYNKLLNINYEEGIKTISTIINSLLGMYLQKKYNKNKHENISNEYILKSIVIYSAIKQELENRVKIDELHKKLDSTGQVDTKEGNPNEGMRHKIMNNLSSGTPAAQADQGNFENKKN